MNTFATEIDSLLQNGERRCIAADKELVTPRIERLRAIRRDREKQIDERIDLLAREKLEYFDS